MPAHRVAGVLAPATFRSFPALCRAPERELDCRIDNSDERREHQVKR